MFNPSVIDIPPVPNQPMTFNFPQCCFGKTNPVKRSFQASWFSNRTWLHYDEANDLTFCHICSVAYKDGKLNNHSLDKAFIINGFSYWKDACVSFKKHDSSKCHRESVDIVLTLKKGKIFFITHYYLETWECCALVYMYILLHVRKLMKRHKKRQKSKNKKETIDKK